MRSDKAPHNAHHRHTATVEWREIGRTDRRPRPMARVNAALNTGDFERDFRSWIVAGITLTLALVGALVHGSPLPAG